MQTPAASLEAGLQNGIAQLGLHLAPAQPGKLLEFLELLDKWNHTYNLSGIRDIASMVSLHLLDSLALAPWIDDTLIADVGTGAGLPGIPLAIVFPEKQFILIDSNSKKTRFIFQAVATLGLDNVEVVHSRVEDYASQQQVDIVTSRAFASLADFTGRCRHLLKPGGKFLAMKGQYPDRELQELSADYQLAACHEVYVPGVDAKRHVLEIRMRQS